MPNRKHYHLSGLAALLLCAGGGGAFAQYCDIGITAVSFGVYDPLPGQVRDTTGRIVGRCQNLTAQAVKIVACIGLLKGSEGSSIDNRRMSESTTASNKLRYQLYKDAARQNIWGSISANQHAKIELTIPANTSTQIFPTTLIYGRILGNQGGAAPGQYASKYPYPGEIDVDIAVVAPQASYTCQAGGGLGASQLMSGLEVSARIDPKCTITTPPSVLDFGAVTGLAVPERTSKFGMRVQCTRDTLYSIALNDGSFSDSPGQRRMINGSSDHIGYEIYQNEAMTIRWGSTMSGATGVIKDTVNGQPLKGTGQNQTHTGYGRVPAQNAASAGTYEDKVLVTVAY